MKFFLKEKRPKGKKVKKDQKGEKKPTDQSNFIFLQWVPSLGFSVSRNQTPNKLQEIPGKLKRTTVKLQANSWQFKKTDAQVNNSW